MASLLAALGNIGKKQLSAVDGRGGWWPLVREPFSGAWQKNQECTVETGIESPALFSCVTLIAGDIAKLRIKLVEKADWGGFIETESPAFSPVLRQPNSFQTHVQFKEYWILSKLTRGNTYVLKRRDARGVVVALHVLDPARVTPMVSDDGSVYYQLKTDNISGLAGDLLVPASEIIHDRFNCVFHPLIGLSPICASGLAALQAVSIQKNSSLFFSNGSMPGGILTAPGKISDDNADRLKRHWEENYTGQNAGRTAVLGDGLTFTPIRMSSVDAQLIEQLKWSAEVIAATFHVPAYKINVGAVPSNNNVEALDSQYYTQCLQKLIEDFEACLDEGLGLHARKDGKLLGTELDLRGLLRMDTAAKVKAGAEGIKAGIFAPNEARQWFDLKPVDGGDEPFLQQQNWSLGQLSDREEIDDKPAVAPPEKLPEDEVTDEELERTFHGALSKELDSLEYA